MDCAWITYTNGRQQFVLILTYDDGYGWVEVEVIAGTEAGRTLHVPPGALDDIHEVAV